MHLPIFHKSSAHSFNMFLKIELKGQKEVAQHIKPLKDVKSKERSLLSLVISPSEEIPRAIDRIKGWTKCDKTNESQSFYKDAKEAITYAVQILETYSKVPDNGLIIYTGIVYTDNGKEDFAITFEPYKRIYCPSNRILYTFDIEALEKLLEPVNPQSFGYFSFLFAVGGIITFQLGAVRLLLRQNPSLFKDHGRVFMITIIVSGSMAVLSSFFLVLSRFLLKSWMKSIHYTILKTIGSFSAILVPFSLGAAVFVPSGDLNWIAYTVLYVNFGGLLYLYSFIWKVACAYHHDERYDCYPVHWAYLLIILVPLSISLLSSFFSQNHRWLTKVFVSFSIIVPLVIAFMRFNREKAVRNSKHHQQDKTKFAIPNTSTRLFMKHLQFQTQQ